MEFFKYSNKHKAFIRELSNIFIEETEDLEKFVVVKVRDESIMKKGFISKNEILELFLKQDVFISVVKDGSILTNKNLEEKLDMKSEKVELESFLA